MKRALSLLLSAVFLLSCIPFGTIYASETEEIFSDDILALSDAEAVVPSDAMAFSSAEENEPEGLILFS